MRQVGIAMHASSPMLVLAGTGADEQVDCAYHEAGCQTKGMI
jgi:hypothetical protein